MDKTKINLERLRAYDEWEESKHPRAKNGQFTSGSGSAGSVEEYMPKGSGKNKVSIAAKGTTNIKAPNGDNVSVSYNKKTGGYNLSVMPSNSIEAG